MAQVRSVIRFQVKPGREGEFEAAFAETGMLTRPRDVPGFVGAELVRGLEGQGGYLVIGTWTDEQAYREWQRRSASGAPAGALARLLETLENPKPGVLYEVVANSDSL
jgi:heme-degrading monooxygenase HmoA